MKKTTALIAAATLALAMSACGTDNEPTKTKTVTETEAPKETPTEEGWDYGETEEAEVETDEPPSPEDYDEADADTDTVKKFGEKYEWLDGSTIEISEPEPYQPDEYGFGGETSSEIVAIDITITNGQNVPLDATYETPTVTSAGMAGDEVYDDTVGLGLEQGILPGDSATFKMAYGVEDSSDMVVEFAPTWDHRTVYWTNSGE